MSTKLNDLPTYSNGFVIIYYSIGYVFSAIALLKAYDIYDISFKEALRDEDFAKRIEIIKALEIDLNRRRALVMSSHLVYYVAMVAALILLPELLMN